jgi:Family of unknown function (DUF6675)
MTTQKNMILGSILLLAVLSPLAAAPPPEKEGVNFIHRDLSFVEDTSELVLMPDIQEKVVFEDELKDLKPSGIVELLYRMPLPDVAEEDMMLHILQSISEISTLKGIEYWSGSRQAMYPYLSDAYAVEKKRSNKVIDDPVFTSLPKKPQTLSVFQEDTTFGKAWYDVTYTVSDDTIRLSMINSTIIRYKMFPVLRNERLRIEMIIIPGEEELLFYGMAAFRLGETFGIKMRLDQSFDHRMSSLQTWFSNQTYP